MDDDGSDDDFEDAHDTFGVEDDMFEAETAGARRQEPLSECHPARPNPPKGANIDSYDTVIF